MTKGLPVSSRVWPSTCRDPIPMQSQPIRYRQGSSPIMTTPASRQTRENYAANPVTWLSLLLIFTGVTFWGVLKIYFITELKDFSALALPLIVTGFIGIMAAKTKHVCMIGTYLAACIMCTLIACLLGVLATSTLLNIYHDEHPLAGRHERLPDASKTDIKNIAEYCSGLVVFLSLCGLTVSFSSAVVSCVGICCQRKGARRALVEERHLRVNLPETATATRTPEDQGQPISLTPDQLAHLMTPPVFSEAPPPYDPAKPDGATDTDPALRHRGHPVPDAEVKFQVRD